MSERDERETPPCVFDPLNAEFSFTIDVAASAINAKCTRHCRLDGFWIGNVWTSPVENGLVKIWDTERVWCNPPFSNIDPWVEKAWDDAAALVCMLLPNHRCEQPFWQRMIEPFRDRAGSVLTTHFLKTRRHFTVDGGKPILNEKTGKRSSPEFGLVVVIWDRRTPVFT